MTYFMKQELIKLLVILIKNHLNAYKLKIFRYVKAIKPVK